MGFFSQGAPHKKLVYTFLDSPGAMLFRIYFKTAGMAVFISPVRLGDPETSIAYISGTNKDRISLFTPQHSPGGLLFRIYSQTSGTDHQHFFRFQPTVQAARGQNWVSDSNNIFFNSLLFHSQFLFVEAIGGVWYLITSHFHSSLHCMAVCRPADCKFLFIIDAFLIWPFHFLAMPCSHHAMNCYHHSQSPLVTMQ